MVQNYSSGAFRKKWLADYVAGHSRVSSTIEALEMLEFLTYHASELGKKH